MMNHHRAERLEKVSQAPLAHRCTTKVGTSSAIVLLRGRIVLLRGRIVLLRGRIVLLRGRIVLLRGRIA